MKDYIIPAKSDPQKKDPPFNPPFSFFAGVKNPAPHAQYDLTKIVKGIRQNLGWKSSTEQLRKLKGHNEASYKALKEQAFAFTPSGVFSYRNNRSLDTHAFVMSLDFDGFTTTDEAVAFRAQVERLPETILAFLSPSGLGVKVLIRLHMPTTEADHHSAWRAVKDFTEKVRDFHVSPDKYAKDISRLCFISHDPDAYYNPNPAAFNWEAYLDDHPHLRQDETRNDEPLESSDFQFEGDIPKWLEQALSHIDADDYNQWLSVGSALRHGGFPFEVWDQWSQTSDKYEASDARYKWRKGFDRIPFEYIIKTAQRKGWTPPWGKQRAKAILKPEPLPEPTEGWKTQQAEIEKAFNSDQNMVLIKADTGVGKDYAKVSYIVQTDPDAQRFVEMLPRIELGEEKVTDFQLRQKEILDRRTVYQWRGVFHNFDSDQPFHIRKILIGESIQCVQPGKFDALRAKGAIPQAVLCPSCPVQNACREKGYLSQTRTAQQADYLITAQDGIFFDKSLAGFAKQVIHDRQRTVTGIVDEVRAHELFSQGVLTKAELRQMVETWEGTPAGKFAVSILSALELGTQPDFEKVQQVIEELSKSETKIITAALTKIRIHGHAFFDSESKIYDGELMLASGTFYPKGGCEVVIASSPDALNTLNERGIPAVFRHEIDQDVLTLSYQQAIQFGFYKIPADDDTTPIADFPKLHPNQHWTPLHQLQRLFEQYPRIEDMPVHYDGESLYFYLPPEIHPSIDKIIMISATAETEIIKKKVFPDREVQVIEAEPARWMDGNEVFQISTAKCPRATVNDKEGNLKGFGQRTWEAMCAEIKRTPDKTHAVITYKSLIEKYNLPPNVITAHFGAAEGENERFARCDVFWILFDPRLPPHEVERRARLLYGRDADPLNYEYDEKKGIYVDERSQRVADHYAVEQLIQAIGRARLVRRKGVRVVIMTARELPGISGRNETTLFYLEDLIIAGGLDSLNDRVQKREAQDAELMDTIKQLIQAGTSDNKICQTLGIHHVRLKQIKTELLTLEPASALGKGEKVTGSQPTIETLIAGCEDVTNCISVQIHSLIRSGLNQTTNIIHRLSESGSLTPSAIKQRLYRMAKSGEIIRTSRGVYALPDAGNDFLTETAQTPESKPAETTIHNDTQEIVDLLKDAESSDWRLVAWRKWERCIRQHAKDFPSRYLVVEKTVGEEFVSPNLQIIETDSEEEIAPSGLIRYKTPYQFDVHYEKVAILNPHEVKPRKVANMAMIAVLSGWNNEQNLQVFKRKYGMISLDDGVEAIRRLWQEVDERHPGEFLFPLSTKGP